MSAPLADLALTAQVLDSLERHRSRDRVELVVGLGLRWEAIEPTVLALVREGCVVVRERAGEPVFACA